MLAKKNRLPSFLIPILFKQGKKINSKFFTLYFLKNNLSLSRWALTIPNKVEKQAAKRNRIKRWLRESVKVYLKDINSSFDVFILARPGLISKGYTFIKTEVGVILNKAGLLK